MSTKSLTKRHWGIKRTLQWFEEKPERMQMDPAKGQLVDRIINAYKSL